MGALEIKADSTKPVEVPGTSVPRRRLNVLVKSERFVSGEYVNMFCMTLVDRLSFAPVKGILAGQECDFLHDASGRPVIFLEESWMVRYSGRGTCKRVGHSGGFGIGQLPA